MKKITGLLLILFIGTGAIAQKGFHLGLTFSPNISWLKPETENVTNEGMKLGYSFGLFGDFMIADNYAIGTGLHILNTGGKIIYPSVSEADISIRYVEIPLTFKLKTNQIGYMTYFGQFGFAGGVNIRSRADISFKTPNANTTFELEDVDFQDETRLLRAALIIGIGAEYNMSGNTSLVFGATFNNGFTNTFDLKIPQADGNGNAASVDAPEKKVKAINNAIMLNLGVLF